MNKTIIVSTLCIVLFSSSSYANKKGHKIKQGVNQKPHFPRDITPHINQNNGNRYHIPTREDRLHNTINRLENNIDRANIHLPRHNSMNNAINTNQIFSMLKSANNPLSLVNRISAGNVLREARHKNMDNEYAISGIQNIIDLDRNPLTRYDKKDMNNHEIINHINEIQDVLNGARIMHGSNLDVADNINRIYHRRAPRSTNRNIPDAINTIEDIVNRTTNPTPNSRLQNTLNRLNPIRKIKEMINSANTRQDNKDMNSSNAIITIQNILNRSSVPITMLDNMKSVNAIGIIQEMLKRPNDAVSVIYNTNNANAIRKIQDIVNRANAPIAQGNIMRANNNERANVVHNANVNRLESDTLYSVQEEN